MIQIWKVWPIELQIKKKESKLIRGKWQMPWHPVGLWQRWGCEDMWNFWRSSENLREAACAWGHFSSFYWHILCHGKWDQQHWWSQLLPQWHKLCSTQHLHFLQATFFPAQGHTTHDACSGPTQCHAEPPLPKYQDTLPAQEHAPVLNTSLHTGDCHW